MLTHCYLQTANIQLEQIDMLFTERISHDETRKPFYHKFQWSVVGNASIEAKRQRKLRKTKGSTEEEVVANDDQTDEYKGSIDHGTEDEIAKS